MHFIFSMSGLIDKFMAFLHLYIENQPREALPFVRRQGSKNSLLLDYAQALPNLYSIKQLSKIIHFTDEDIHMAHDTEKQESGKGSIA